MSRSLLLALLSLACAVPTALDRAAAQAPEVTGWKAATPTMDSRYGDPGAAAAQPLPGGAPAAAPITPTPMAANEPITHAQVSRGTNQLPNDHGQVWREYDISPYTIRLESSAHPEQLIVDWILRETGFETWHSTPVGLLSADRTTLRVYHTPQMQAVVADIVDRFVSTKAQNHGFGLRILTLKNPNWRTRAIPLMTPIPVQSPGVQAWIMAREDAAVMLAEMRSRTDFREHTTAHQMVLNGQTSIVSTMRPRTYSKGIIANQTTWPGFQPELGQIDEGFSLEFSPLLSTDAATTDAVVKLKLSQIEKMIPVQLEVPSVAAANQKAQIDVPQVTAVQLHERFRWPTDHVLLLSIGVVATPGPEKANPLTDMLPLPKSAPRADALLLVESSGTVNQPLPSVAGTPGVTPLAVPMTARQTTPTFHGRY
ncbi:hypothetical protein [Lacipirellula sp.]|uniref:hypothetical protein n=1 Tax=Lacipirellula sp. TaxID=2691419 RepID=UPI003D103CB5